MSSCMDDKDWVDIRMSSCMDDKDWVDIVFYPRSNIFPPHFITGETYCYYNSSFMGGTLFSLFNWIYVINDNASVVSVKATNFITIDGYREMKINDVLK